MRISPSRDKSLDLFSCIDWQLNLEDDIFILSNMLIDLRKILSCPRRVFLCFSSRSEHDKKSSELIIINIDLMIRWWKTFTNDRFPSPQRSECEARRGDERSAIDMTDGSSDTFSLLMMIIKGGFPLRVVIFIVYSFNLNERRRKKKNLFDLHGCSIWWSSRQRLRQECTHASTEKWIKYSK